MHSCKWIKIKASDENERVDEKPQTLCACATFMWKRARALALCECVFCGKYAVTMKHNEKSSFKEILVFFNYFPHSQFSPCHTTGTVLCFLGPKYYSQTAHRPQTLFLFRTYKNHEIINAVSIRVIKNRIGSSSIFEIE